MRAELRYFVLLVNELFLKLFVRRLQLGYRVQTLVHLVSKIVLVAGLLMALGLWR